MGINETLIDHLRSILQVLQQLRMKYALAGGLAFSALIEPRATVDIDLLVLFEHTSIHDVFHALEPAFDALLVHDAPMPFHGITIWRAVGFKHQREIILDFLLAASEFDRQVLQRAISLEFMGMELRVVTCEDLILLKKCAHRDQDLVDITRIYQRFHDEINHEYIAYWSQKLGLQEPSV